MLSNTAVMPQEADIASAEILLAATDLFRGEDGTIKTEDSGAVARRIAAICGVRASRYDKMIRGAR